jgi:hypothetical protein
LTGALRQKWEELAQSGSQNLIADLSLCSTTDEHSFDSLIELHENMYSGGQSLVFANVPATVLTVLKQKELHHTLNFAPTIIEAVDIISMEILERDLFNEES